MMAKRSKTRRPRDLNQLAALIAKQSTEQAPEALQVPELPKNQAAVELGRLGGLKGGLARAKSLTKSQRSKIARTAALARWKKRKR